MRKRRTSNPVHTVTVHGFVRGALIDAKTGKVRMGRWHKNAITQTGFQDYIANTIGGLSGSKQISAVQLATQTASPSSTQTSAAGEFEVRKTFTPTVVSSQTLRAVVSFATNEATQSTLGACAMYNTTSAGTAGSVATYSTSNKTTNQTFNLTYEWRFA